MNGPAPLRHALSTAAGKDATLALHRARDEGLEVPLAFCLYDGETGRVRFHGTPIALVQAQARALELELVALPTSPDTFEARFLDALGRLRELGAGGVVFGNIHLADVRAWYEERTSAAGLRHVEPLWGDPSSVLVREALSAGYRARVVSVDLARAEREWLGRELTPELVSEMEAHGVDACGEHGEYHTFVFDGPLFSSSVDVRLGRTIEAEGHALVDLVADG